MRMDHVVQMSGGAGSWAASHRVIQRYGRENVTLLFADVKIEDEDLYRFLDEVEADLGVPITRVAEGRDPWEVFRDVRYLGNTRIDPCSRILKRDFLRAYLEEHFDPASTVVYLGIDWTEEHRFKSAKSRWNPWTINAPLCEPPYLNKDHILAEMRKRGIEPPRLYELGFAHNNCGGFCIKQGQAGFKNLLEKMPHRYDEHARKEQELREFLGKDVSILRDRTLRGRAAAVGATPDEVIRYGDRLIVGRTGRTVPPLVPLTLVELRDRVNEGSDDTDPHDIGGCGCVA